MKNEPVHNSDAVALELCALEHRWSRAAGTPYRERRVKQASVVYFALEGQEGST